QEKADEKTCLGEDDHEQEDVAAPANQVVERVRAADDAGEELHQGATCLARPRPLAPPSRPRPAACCPGCAFRRTNATRTRPTPRKRRRRAHDSRKARSRP